MRDCPNCGGTMVWEHYDGGDDPQQQEWEETYLQCTSCGFEIYSDGSESEDY